MMMITTNCIYSYHIFCKSSSSNWKKAFNHTVFFPLLFRSTAHITFTFESALCMHTVLESGDAVVSDFTLNKKVRGDSTVKLCVCVVVVVGFCLFVLCIQETMYECIYTKNNSYIFLVVARIPHFFCLCFPIAWLPNIHTVTVVHQQSHAAISSGFSFFPFFLHQFFSPATLCMTFRR